MQFNCTVAAGSAPEITWRHNGAEIKATSPTKYHVSQDTPTTDPEGRGFIRTGTLFIFSPDELDTGLVECVAVSNETRGDEDMPQDIAGTQLTVLGKS